MIAQRWAAAALLVLGTACSHAAANAPDSGAPAPLPSEAHGMASAPIDSSLMLKTASGLMFRDLVVGHGPLVTPGAWVQVHYVGQLTDGTIFDANGPNDSPLRFQVGARRVIAGWDEGVNGMRVGGKRQLIIPPALGYGARGAGPIPGNATLVFLVEVVNVN
jgi:FKBP-type peptidyl-prolyl cis-trans isomerase